MSDHIVRNRKVYGETCRAVVDMLYGFGISPDRILMERVEGQNGNRARFDILVDDRAFFEEMTVEEIQKAIEGMRMAKHLFKGGDINLSNLFTTPSDRETNKVIALSFHDQNLANEVVPVPNSVSNVRDIAPSAPRPIAPSPTTESQMAASQMKVKNPLRVAAGRRGAAARWSGAPAPGGSQIASSQTVAQSGRQVIQPSAPRQSSRAKFG